jgi:hypothetical protein
VRTDRPSTTTTKNTQRLGDRARVDRTDNGAAPAIPAGDYAPEIVRLARLAASIHLAERARRLACVEREPDPRHASRERSA